MDDLYVFIAAYLHYWGIIARLNLASFLVEFAPFFAVFGTQSLVNSSNGS